MTISNPAVSVVIPAYNQAQYLRQAIDSVLAQTYQNFEIIVVDDGSTDDTAAIAKSYGDRITYLYQENLGLAGARNTGIRHAQNKLIGLLDADDEWLPQYLERMTALATEERDAAVYYCCAQAIAPDGNTLPQIFGCRENRSGDLLDILLRVNFLIPSTVMLNYETIKSGERFDVKFRRKQDRELWIRLLKQGYSFRELPEVLVRYRIHEESLSVDVSSGQQATMDLVTKHFGADDGNPSQWTRQKRLAYGGAYRYFALVAVQRQNDWRNGARYLKKALEVDPTLADDIDLFYELALGNQPAGYRGTSQHLNLEANARQIETLLAEIFATENLGLQAIQSSVYGTAYYALGLLAYNTGQYAWSRRYLAKALRNRPGLAKDPHLSKTLAKSFLGADLLSRLRALRQTGAADG